MEPRKSRSRAAVVRLVTPLQRWLPVGRTLPEEAWWHRHRAILVLLWLHVAAIPVYGVALQHGVLHSTLESLVIAVPALLATTSRLPRHIRTWASALGILSSSAVLVHLSGGLIEMHFHFFVMVAVVALYQDWIPFLLAVGYVLVHHGAFGALDPSSVYNHPAAIANPWTWAAIHALFITGISAVCLVTWRFNETALTLRRRAEEESARLYEAERTARGAAESARARLALLAEASRVMYSSLDLHTTLQNVGHLAVPAFADVAVVDLLEEDGSIRRVASIAGPLSQDVARELEQRVPDPSNKASLVMRALRTGEPTLLEEIGEELISSLEREGGYGDALRRLAPTSAIIVPLSGRHGVLGALSFATTAASGRRFGPDDLSLAEELARRAATSVENARLYARERSVAETLQRSLLPESLPEIPGITASVRYVPAGEGNEVGGDWYDCFIVPGSRVAIVMGDVVGRGMPAASLMGQLRNAIRAHTLDGLAPGEVVTKLNRLMRGSGPQPSLATVILAILDPEDGSVRMVNAGHPPPLIISADGSTRFGPEGLAVPLGTVSTWTFRETVDVLRPGDTLLLYTDGLVESRDVPLEEGLRRLQAATAEAPRDLEALCEHVFRENLRDRRVEDDAALLAVRPIELGDRLHLRVPSDPAMVGSVRTTLRRWLWQIGAREEEIFDLLVACGEACANAIEHAHGPVSSYFEVDASAGEKIAITVRNQGRWRPPRGGRGGHGIRIMRELMDEVEIQRGEKGTEVRLSRALAPHPIRS